MDARGWFGKSELKLKVKVLMDGKMEREVKEFLGERFDDDEIVGPGAMIFSKKTIEAGSRAVCVNNSIAKIRA